MKLNKETATAKIEATDNLGRKAEILEAYVTRTDYVGEENREACDIITKSGRAKEVKCVTVKPAKDYKVAHAVQNYAHGPAIHEGEKVSEVLTAYLANTDYLVVYHGEDIEHLVKTYYIGFKAMFEFLFGAAGLQYDSKRGMNLRFGYKTETKGKNQRLANFEAHGVIYG